MKKFLLRLCAFAAAGLAACSPAPDHFRIVSFNIRMDRDPASDGPHHWLHRREAVADMIRRERPVLLGLQEEWDTQMEYLLSELGDAYGRVGVGRLDGKLDGEMNAIYYRRDAVELVDWGNFWLSESPETVSIGWDACCSRTFTWARLRFIGSGRELFYCNTHLDHVGARSRREAMRLIRAKMEELNPAGLPLLLTADFNTTPDDAVFDDLRLTMHDAREEAPETDRRITYNAWGRSEGKIIDHIFFAGDALSVEGFRTLDGDYGVPYISDHYPVEAHFTLRD